MLGLGQAAQAQPPWQIHEGNLRTAIGVQALADRFPHSSRIVRRQLTAAHSVGDAGRLRAGLRRLAELGYAPSAATLELLAEHVSETEMAALRPRFEANRTVVAASRPFALVPAERRLVEGIAWDARHRRLFASSVVGRELLVGEGGAWRAVPGLDTGSLFGLAVDEARRRLWIASGALDQTPIAESAFRGLIALDLDTLRTVRRLAIEGTGSPADIAVAADGSVYASDPLRGTIYRAGADGDAIAVLVPAGRLANPQGLVPSADGRRLYVSDYGHGLAVIDLDSGDIHRLESDVDTMLDGIDGLFAWQNGLIAIQNGTSPRRILHLQLGADGSRITAVRVLERAHPGWGEPTLGHVRGDDLLYVADAQWERFGPGGAKIGERPLRPTAIRILPLRAGGAPPS